MNTSSVADTRHTRITHHRGDDPGLIKRKKPPVGAGKLEYFIRRMYYQFWDTLYSIVIISGVLFVYKAAGLHAWWIRIVSGSWHLL